MPNESCDRPSSQVCADSLAQFVVPVHVLAVAEGAYQVNKRQIAQALTAHKEREAAKRAERLVVAGYPYSHNPYLAHEPVEDCFAGCVRTDGHARFIPASTKDGAK